MVFVDTLPGSADPLPLPAPRAPAPAAPVKRLSMSAPRPSAAPTSRSSASLAPALSDSAANSPAVHGLLRPSAPSLPAPYLPALLDSALRLQSACLAHSAQLGCCLSFASAGAALRLHLRPGVVLGFDLSPSWGGGVKRAVILITEMILTVSW